MKATKNTKEIAYYSVSEFAKKKKRTPARIYQLIKDGEIKAIKIGNTVLIPKNQ